MDDLIATASAIQPHNERAAAVWSSGGRDYEEIIRGVYDGIDAAVAALAPQPGERILDVATGTGITARACARADSQLAASSSRLRRASNASADWPSVRNHNCNI